MRHLSPLAQALTSNPQPKESAPPYHQANSKWAAIREWLNNLQWGKTHLRTWDSTSALKHLLPAPQLLLVCTSVPNFNPPRKLWPCHSRYLLSEWAISLEPFAVCQTPIYNHFYIIGNLVSWGLRSKLKYWCNNNHALWIVFILSTSSVYDFKSSKNLVYHFICQ